MTRDVTRDRTRYGTRSLLRQSQSQSQSQSPFLYLAFSLLANAVDLATTDRARNEGEKR